MKLDPAQVLLDEQPISIDVLLEKYAKGDEKTVDEVRRRVARGLAAVEKPEIRAEWEQRFHQAMVDTGGDLLMRLHAAQRFELHAPVPKRSRMPIASDGLHCVSSHTRYLSSKLRSRMPSQIVYSLGGHSLPGIGDFPRALKMVYRKLASKSSES